MTPTEKKVIALACLLASVSALRPPIFGPNPNQPWSLPKELLDSTFASPNATGNYGTWQGSSLQAAPAFSTGSWNVTIAVKDGIPLANSSEAGVNASQVVTVTRVSLAPAYLEPGKPLDQSNFLDKENDTSVSLCLIMGFRDTETMAPSAGDSAEQKLATCSGVEKCRSDLGSNLRLAEANQNKNASKSNCYPTPALPTSCKEQLGWKSIVSSNESKWKQHDCPLPVVILTSQQPT